MHGLYPCVSCYFFSYAAPGLIRGHNRKRLGGVSEASRRQHGNDYRRIVPDTEKYYVHYVEYHSTIVKII